MGEGEDLTFPSSLSSLSISGVSPVVLFPLFFSFPSVIRSQRQALDFRTFDGVLTLPELLVDVDGRPISEDETEVYPCGLQSVAIFNDDFRLYRRGENSTSKPPQSHLKPPVTSPLPWLDMQTYEIGKAYREGLQRIREGLMLLKKKGIPEGEEETRTTTSLRDEEEKIKKALAQGEKGDKESEEGEGGGAWEQEIPIDSSDVAYHWDFLRYMVNSSSSFPLCLAISFSPLSHTRSACLFLSLSMCMRVGFDCSQRWNLLFL